MTPLKTGKYWYTTLGLPGGVTAEVVTMASGHDGVRFMFTTREQHLQLAEQLMALGSELRYGAGVPEGVEPPEVPERPAGLGGTQ